MKQKINLVFIVLFMMVITLPYLFAHRDVQGRVSDMENRTLQGYPSLVSEDGKINKEYTSQFENWLNDNLRGRSVLVEANAAMQYSLFQNIVKTDILQGKDGWLFANDLEQIVEYQRSNLMTEEELAFYTSQLQRLSDYLKERDISFYYMQCYAKETIYPDKYNGGVLQIENVSRTERVIKSLEQETDIHVIDTKRSLDEQSLRQDTYFQYADLVHWNEAGAYLGYQALMNEIHEEYQDVAALGEADYQIEESEQITSIYGFEYPYREICPIYKIGEPKAFEITEDTRDDWNWLHYKEYTHVYCNDDSDNDKKILVLGDSYIRMFLKDDIAESFSETLSIDRSNIPLIDKIVEEYQPDIVVLECVDCVLSQVLEALEQIDFLKN